MSVCCGGIKLNEFFCLSLFFLLLLGQLLFFIINITVVVVVNVFVHYALFIVVLCPSFSFLLNFHKENSPFVCVCVYHFSFLMFLSAYYYRYKLSFFFLLVLIIQIIKPNGQMKEENFHLEGLI